ncbi:MAG: NADH-quinone oxidoreductase subunit NuoI [Candidatus Thiodiazotropha sp.]
MFKLGKRLQHTIQSYLLIELWKGMSVTGRRLFDKKFTVLYPEERIPKSPRFKGLHALRRYANGEERCIACKLCEAVCPACCISIEAEPAGKEGMRRTTRYEIDLFKCIYCGYCEEACPVDAIVLTRFTDLHFESREGSVIDKQRLLAMGDRLEKQIAADRAQDAPYR